MANSKTTFDNGKYTLFPPGMRWVLENISWCVSREDGVKEGDVRWIRGKLMFARKVKQEMKFKVGFVCRDVPDGPPYVYWAPLKNADNTDAFKAWAAKNFL